MKTASMADVIVPKSDQWNSDDFIGGPMTFKIREVQIKGGQEQPVNILVEGSDKAFRPCKSMCRVLVSVWGADAKAYVGRSLTLYRDPSVKWGGMDVGGIRISHMSHIDKPETMALTTTRASRKPYTVKPLVVQENSPKLATPQQQKDLWARAQAAGVTPDQFMAQFGSLKALAADKMAAVESWLIGREPITAPATCEACSGLLIEGRCHNPECANGEPTEVQESLI